VDTVIKTMAYEISEEGELYDTWSEYINTTIKEVNDAYAKQFRLQLNADLVTLSACNTGRGKQIKGEGVIGLTRAFMYAGTPAVAVTLWSVETMSAKELNVGMFEYLNAGQTRADALRAFKLDMIRGKYDKDGKKYSQPRFWAPLVVFGDAM